jgi:hypothetical protein
MGGVPGLSRRPRGVGVVVGLSFLDLRAGKFPSHGGVATFTATGVVLPQFPNKPVKRKLPSFLKEGWRLKADGVVGLIPVRESLSLE